MVKPDYLIPPDSELGQLLSHLMDSTDDAIWKVARITNDLIEELAGGEVTRTDIYKAVARRSKGRKPRTIRSWADVAADVPVKVEKKYANLLSFDHFKTARRLVKNGYAPSIEFVLQWCTEGNDNKIYAGTFHTVGEMLNQFLPEDTFGNSAERYWLSVREKLVDNALLIDNDTERALAQKAIDDLDLVWRKNAV